MLTVDKGKISDEQAKTYGHLKIVGLVGSIDNDMSMTDMTIGAPTALHRICEAIDNIESTAFSHSRAFVVEVMGRHCGWLALLAGVRWAPYPYCYTPVLTSERSSGADFIFIPERPPQTESWQDEMCKMVQRVRVSSYFTSTLQYDVLSSFSFSSSYVSIVSLASARRSLLSRKARMIGTLSLFPQRPSRTCCARGSVSIHE